jgi:hypothetical protein
MSTLESRIMGLIQEVIQTEMDKVYETHEMPSDLEGNLIELKNELIDEMASRNWVQFILREWRVQMINNWLEHSFPSELSDEQIRELFEHMYGKEE